MMIKNDDIVETTKTQPVRFKALTPSNIDSLSEQEVLALVKNKSGLPDKKVRLEIIKMVYEILGFTLSNDALLCYFLKIMHNCAWQQLVAVKQRFHRLR